MDKTGREFAIEILTSVGNDLRELGNGRVVYSDADHKIERIKSAYETAEKEGEKFFNEFKQAMEELYV